MRKTVSRVTKAAMTGLLAVIILGLLAQNALAYALMNDGYYQRLIPINTVNYVSSSYAGAVSAAVASWNSTSLGVSISSGSAPYKNVLYTSSRADGWCGLYQPQVRNYSYYPHMTTTFRIIINTRTCDPLGNQARQSVVCHEFGHAWGLADRTSGTAVMNWNRDRTRIYVPQADDKSGVVASWNR